MRAKSNQVAQFIKTRRKELKLSQLELAQRVGMCRKPKAFQATSNIERGLQQLPISHIVKTAQALEVDRETLIDLMVADYKQNILRTLEITNEVTNQ